MSETDTRERYIDAVLSELPPALPGRDQIAAELRAHIEERLAAGMPLRDVLDRLGDPRRLAESYVSAVPLVAAPLGRRFLAKIIDVGVFLAAIATLWFVATRVPELAWILVLGIAFVAIGCTLYFVIAEYAWGTTIGKRLFGLHVVRESGTRIGLGQSFVRQFPLIFGFLFIDAIFIPFTERRQRAFQLVSKTRVVHAERGPHDIGARAPTAQAFGLGAAM